ncbi:WD40 repeat domain-containing protein [Actinoplanes solisilvae]|uniref:WD40 repeat domain-containing protein n=1 Tax=Actinoplanes solisilvae TaxID=2486853 RepID=UPI000FDA2AF9|nr:WD40 repeat domain-containing protein [Actinoplanes solisilvae]
MKTPQWTWRAPIAHRSPVWAVTGVRGLVLTAGGDDMIRSWDAVTGTPGGFAVRAHVGMIGSLGVTEARGRTIVVCADQTAVRRFDLATGDEIGDPLRAPGSWLPVGGLGQVTLATESGEPLVLAETYSKLGRWDVVTGEPVGRPWTADLGRLLAMTAWTGDDGHAVVATSDNAGVVQRWDVLTGNPVGPPLDGHDRPVTALLAVGGAVFGQEYQGSLCRWDVTTGELLDVLPHRSEGIAWGGLAADSTGRALFFVDQSTQVWRWDLTRPEPVAEKLPGSAGHVKAVAVVPSELGPLCVTGNEKGATRRWDLSGRPVGDDLPGHPAGVQQLIAVPRAVDGRPVLVSAGGDGTRCWDAGSGAPLGDPDALSSTGNRLAGAWLPSGRLVLATGTHDGLVRFDALTRGKEITDRMGKQPVWTVASGVQRDGRPFFAGGTAAGEVHFVDAETGATVRPKLRVSKSQVLAVAVTTLDDGTIALATGGEDQFVVLWDAVTGEQIGAPLPVGECSVMELTFRRLPDGRLLVIACDDGGAVWRWDAATGESLGEPLTADDELPLTLDDVAFGRLFAAAHHDVVRCWDIVTGRVLGVVPQAQSAVTTELPDGRTALAIGREDGTLTVTFLPGADGSGQAR